MKNQFKKKIIIIGAKSFLGSETFCLFDHKKFHLILTTRKKNDLLFFKKKFKKFSFDYFQLDSNNDNSIKKTFKKIKKKHKKVDGLINFAYKRWTLKKINRENFKDAINYNVVSPFNLTKYLIEIFGIKNVKDLSIILSHQYMV